MAQQTIPNGPTHGDVRTALNANVTDAETRLTAAATKTGVETLTNKTIASPVFTGGQRVPVTAVNNANYSVLVTDSIVAMTNATAPRTITLPTAATAAAGRLYIVKDQSGNATTHNITISVSGGGTIDGATSFVLDTNYQGVGLYSSGVSWFTTGGS